MSKPLILAALGARGTGKSAWTKQTIDKLKPSRLAVWDLMQEYGDLHSTDNIGEFVRLLHARTFRVAFHPSRDDRRREVQFEYWCNSMLTAGKVLCVVEELAFVTKPMKAPSGWREMILLGRHQQHQLSIIGTSQRPASIDKDFLSNCDLVHSGRLAYKPDAVKASEVLGVPFEDILRLPDLHYIERAAGVHKATAGVLSFAGKKTRAKAPSDKQPQGQKLPADASLKNTPTRH
jgi:hypothetical protein